MGVNIIEGDCLTVLPTLEADSFHACVTDPPYGLEFMGKEWDAPWKYGINAYGMKDTKGRMAAPSFTSSRNPMCKECHKHKRGSRNHVACSCAIPQFDEMDHKIRDIHAFQDWCFAWATAVLRVLKPGAHLLAFGGTRTYHRLACAIEDAGFEIRDAIMWHYGSGFPKSHDVSKGIDRAAKVEGIYGEAKSAAHAGWIERGRMRGDDGHEGYQRPWMKDEQAVDRNARQYIGGTDAARQWSGWGTALKPATEIIVVARKPLVKPTVAANVLAHGCGALNIDGCRVPTDSPLVRPAIQRHGNTVLGHGLGAGIQDEPLGRWPANLIHDGSEEVLAAFPAESSVTGKRTERSRGASVVGTNWLSDNHRSVEHMDSGSAARFFYAAKADKTDRLGSKHPTVKPVDLMRYLVRLVTPPGGHVLDPFAGSGTTAMAALAEGFHATLIERETEYVEDVRRRMQHVEGSDTPLFGALEGVLD